VRRSVALAGSGVLLLLLGLTPAYAETAPAPVMVFGALLLVLAIIFLAVVFFTVLHAGVSEGGVWRPSYLQEIFTNIYSIHVSPPVKINVVDGIPIASPTPSLFSMPSTSGISIPTIDISSSWSWDRD